MVSLIVSEVSISLACGAASGPGSETGHRDREHSLVRSPSLGGQEAQAEGIGLRVPIHSQKHTPVTQLFSQFPQFPCLLNHPTPLANSQALVHENLGGTPDGNS